MTREEIEKLHQKVTKCLDEVSLHDAFEGIMSLVRAADRSDMSDEAQRLHLSYTLMLKYLSNGFVDPQRADILTNIRQSLHVLNDRSYIALQEAESHQVFYARRRELANKPLVGIIEDYREALKTLSLMTSIPDTQQDKKAILAARHVAEDAETRLFNKVWCTFPLNTEDANSLQLSIMGDILPVHARCLLVSALFVGLMKFYDEAKLSLLLEAYLSSDSRQVQLRALVCAVLTLVAHKRRVGLSKAINNRLETLMDNPEFVNDLWVIQVQLARSRNTENVRQRVRNDFIPNLMKVRPDIIDKIKDQDFQALDLTDEAANPDWQQWLDNSGIARKMEEFNEMQSEGSDVFIATFAHLKSFPFFKTLSNWFMPFHDKHSIVDETLGHDARSLATIIEQTPYLCNSDKFSFCLSLGSLPGSQREMLSAQLEEQTAAFREASSDVEADEVKQRGYIVNQFVQDLYRFFKIFSRRHEFVAVMDDPTIDLTSCKLLMPAVHDTHVLELLGELYLKNAFYEDAIRCFKLLENTESEIDEHLYQKIGFAYQNAGKLEEAIKYYERYDLLHENDVWNLRHIAACHRALGHSTEALSRYRQAEAINPENVAIALTIGHVLLEQNLTNEALQQYFKADLLPNAKHRAWRPIAWCSFLLKDYDRAIDYYNRIEHDDKPSPHDWLNHGHVLLCQKQPQEAIEAYRRSLRAMDNDTDAWRKAFKGDALELRLHGISAVDQALIADAVCAKITSE